jgi:hypothetical protein
LDLAYGIACDSSNNIYVSGNFQDVVDFDPGSSVDSHTSNGSDDAFITKFASGGYHDYARTFGGPASDSAIGVATDAQGSPYATGYFQGSCDFAPTGSPCYDPSLVLTSKGNQDAFAVKYQPDGCW